MKRDDFIAGAGGGKAGGGGGGIDESPDNLSSVARVRFIDLIGEGEIEGLVNREYSIYLDGVTLKHLDGTPNYRPFRWDSRVGTQAQTPINGFTGTQSESAVGLKLLKAQGKIVRSVPDADADAVRVTVSVNGLSLTTDAGKIVGTRVEYTISIRVAGGSWVVGHRGAIDGKTRGRYQRSHEISLVELGEGPYEVSVERTTDDSNSSLLVNDLHWDSYTIINYEKFSYPNSALVALELDARYFSNVPARAYHVRGLKVKVPTNYDPVTRVYATTGPGTTNGAWDGTFKTAYTNNPAWCYRELLLSKRFGLGKRITESMIDKWALYTIAKYCDQPVPTGNVLNVMEVTGGGRFSVGGKPIAGVPRDTTRFEPRFTCNCVINTKEDAYRVLNQLASVFRAMPYWSTGSVFLTQDAPAEPEFIYTNANVEGGLFDYAGTGRSQRHTTVMVGWNDPDEDFKQKFEYVEDREGIARYGVRPLEIIAFACTSRSQARRVGLWTLYTERMETEAISFVVGMDSAKVVPGRIVQIMDAHRVGARWGGRIVSAHRNYATYSQQFTNAVWGKTSNGGGSDPIVLDNFATAPNGTLTAARVTFSRVSTSGDDWSLLDQHINGVGSPNTRSVWLRTADPETTTYLLIRAGRTGAYVEVEVTDSWKRFEVPNLVTTDGDIQIGLRRGNGSQQPLTSDVLVWGAQCNKGVKALGYVPTTISALDGVELDAAVTLPSGSYTLSIMAPDLTVVEKTVNVAAESSLSVLPVATSFSSYPQTMAIWTLASASVAPRTARVVSVRQKTDVSFEIVCVQHEPSKYEAIENGTIPETMNYTFLSLDQLPAPSNLTVVENSFKRTVTSPVQSNLFASWDASLSSLVRGYAIRVVSASESRALPEQRNPYFTLENIVPDMYTVHVTAVSHLGRPGVEASYTVQITGVDTVPPADVSGFVGSITPANGAKLVWQDVADFIDYYEIREGTDWNTATFVDSVKATSKSLGSIAAGTHTYLIRAIDTSGNPSANATSFTLVVPAAGAPSISYQVIGTDEMLSWVIPSSPFTIDRYEIREGATLGTSTLVDTIKGTSYRRKVRFSGEKVYWVAAIDDANNTGNYGSVTVQITAPGEVTSSRAEVIDNNALLYWGPPATGSLPVDRYEVRKGASFAAGALVGSNGNSTFAAVFEQEAGVYNYWIAAIDSAENVGPAIQIVANISQPPDYILRTDWNSSFTGTRVNMTLEDGMMIGPVDTSEDWATHFSSHGWTSIQDQINAGYPLYAEPGLTSCSYTEVFDYGTVLAATIMSATLGYTTIDGAVSVSCQISYKAAAGDPWTNAPAGAQSALASNFRYVQVTWTVTCAAGANLIGITSFNLKLSNKSKTDNGTATITNAAAGVTVPFNIDFVDADTPMIQPHGSTPLMGVVDFLDTPNPTQFTVYLYNTSGVKVTGSFSWTARGY